MPVNGAVPEYVYSYFAGFHVGAHTVNQLGISGSIQTFDGQREPAIDYNYLLDGQVLGTKHRSVKGKRFKHTANKTATLYNADCLADCVAKGEALKWTEGEKDVATMVESGYPHTVSTRDGSTSFGSLDAHKDILAKVKCHILAGDMDEAGLKWRNELARRLGRHKCRYVTWPQGCKDATDVLQKYDDRVLAVRRGIEAAQAFPVRGILELPNINELFAKPPAPTMSTGVNVLDEILRLPADGRLIIGVGKTEQGKSAWMKFLMAHTAQHHNRRWLAFAGEDHPDDFWQDMVCVYVGKPRHMLNEEDRAKASFLRGRIRLLEVDDDEMAPTFSSLMERAEESVLAHGTTDMLIDPWNDLEYEQGGDTMTAYVRRCLRSGRHRLCKTHGCNLWIMTHTGKPRPDDGELNAYSAADSAHFANKADLGLGVHRKKDTNQTEVSILKSKRSSLWGKSGHKRTMEFNYKTGRYTDPPVDFSDLGPIPDYWDK